jgi:NADH dehydrogenase FAD-containing subunit
MTVAGQREHRRTGGGPARVVIVGAGFGGLAAMRRLARAGMQTTLIDRNVYSTFQPLLYEVATAGLTSSDVAFPARSLSRRYHAAFRHGELTSIDHEAGQIILAGGATLGYDYLILATGVAAAYHGIPGAAEHSLGLYTRHDAIVLRDRIMTGLERISQTGLSSDVAVTVIGGGATGVELAGSLADLRNIALPVSYPEIDRTRLHISFIERAPALLAPFHPALRDYTRRQLAGRGVEIRLGTAIAEITPGRVLLADGTAVPSDITVWAAGVAAPEPASSWACRKQTAAASAPAPASRSAGTTGSSRSATSPSPAISPCRSSPSRPCRWASTPPTRSADWRPGSRQRRSATATKASWPPSDTAPPSSSYPATYTSTARPPGSPGSRCT